MATEKRLIDANALEEYAKNMEELALNRACDTPSNSPCYSRYSTQYSERREFRKLIQNAPTVDAVEVVHGRWEPIRNAYGELEGWIHMDCGREVKAKENYCPNCGAKMDGLEGS